MPTGRHVSQWAFLNFLLFYHLWIKLKNREKGKNYS